MRRTTSVGVLAALTLAVRLAHAYDTDDENFRTEVFKCEVALGILSECCPSFDASRVPCRYLHEATASCDFNTDVWVRPALSEPESQCIASMRCDELEAHGVCERAQSASDYVTSSRSNSIESPMPWRTPSTHPPVCP